MSTQWNVTSLEASKAPTTVPTRIIDTEVVAVFQHPEESGKSTRASKKAAAGIVESGMGSAGSAGGVKGYAESIERLRKSDVFQGRPGSLQYLRFGGEKPAESALFLGLGRPSELTEEKLRAAGGNVWIKLKAEKAKSVSIAMDSFFESTELSPNLSRRRMARAFAEGLVLGAYRFEKYKTGSKSGKADDSYQGPSQITFVTRDLMLEKEISEELDQVEAIARAVQVTRDWSNEPSNYGTPEYYAGEAAKLARAHGLRCKVLTEREAAREKMGLFLGVGQGAEREGRIVVLEYVPGSTGGRGKGAAGKASKAGKGVKTLALVGKGITFDSGGISIKPSMKMEEMKHDMTGAATVMGAMILAASWKVSNRVVGIMAFTENMPDGKAIQPGNVLTSRAGKTVEVINTDAEGRLILADVLDFAHEFKPDAIVDIATLTGAVSVALGKHCCGVLGNDDSLIESVRRAGEVNGERIWQLPLFEEYFEDLKSDIADMKNSANDSNGGTIRGAIFLKQFIRKGTRWAHLDIAATAWGLTHLSYYPKKGASGAYVRTLAQLAADL